MEVENYSDILVLKTDNISLSFNDTHIH